MTAQSPALDELDAYIEAAITKKRAKRQYADILDLEVLQDIARDIRKELTAQEAA